MINAQINNNQLHSPVRNNRARVELLEGSTLLQSFTYKDKLISFDIQRVGADKFFGFGICQRLNVHVEDLNRELDITTANTIDVSFGAENSYVYPYPAFKVSEVHRDETTNELSITAYDALYSAAERTTAEITLDAYTIRQYAIGCATLLGLPLKIVGVEDESVFDTYYPNGANFEGNETIREALDAIAEVTQTIYYVSANWELIFRRLDKDGEPVTIIDKSQYFELDNGDNRRLSDICHATELGDNYTSTKRGYVEGNPVEVTDCASGKPLDLTVVNNGETLGKNLFDYTVSRLNGASHIESKADGVIQIRGSNAKWASANIPIPACKNLVGKTITITAKIKTSGANNASIRLMWLNSVGGGQGDYILYSPYISSTDYVEIKKTGIVPAQPTAEHTSLCLMLYSNLDATIDSGTYYAWYKDIQVEIGDTATEYEPYNPDATPEGIAVTASGKNLFNKLGISPTATTKYYSDGDYITSSATTRNEYMSVNIADIWHTLKATNCKKVTFSFDLRSDKAGRVTFYTLGQYLINFAYSNKGNAFDSTTEWQHFYTTVPIHEDSFTLNASDTNNQCNLSWYGTYDTGVKPYIRNLQIEISDTESEYEDYTGPVQVGYADAEGKVEGLVSYTPTTVITANHPNAIVKTKYLKPQVSGTTQYIRDNPFWELREDIVDLVDAAGEVMSGFRNNQFDCSWRGNYLLEIGDKIGLISKDNKVIYSYVLNDTVEYDGTLKESTLWKYEDADTESTDNPTSIGDAIKWTYAKVDKLNKEINLVASEANSNSEKIAQIQLTTEEINSSVSELKTATEGTIGDLTETVKQLSTEVKQTADDFKISINRIETQDTTSVTTSTGFTFNENGLKITKTDTEINTTITEDGMTIKKGSKEVLTANNGGVKAVDLHATTYLIVGKNSRFEDYGSNRTGCFWIGG